MDELSSHETRRDRGRRVGLRDLIKLRLTCFAFTFFFFSTLVFGALQNFAPSLLRDLYGFLLAAATSALTAYLLGSVVGLATGGFLAGAKKGQERIVGFSFLCSAALALLLGFFFDAGLDRDRDHGPDGFWCGNRGPIAGYARENIHRSAPGNRRVRTHLRAGVFRTRCRPGHRAAYLRHAHGRR